MSFYMGCFSFFYQGENTMGELTGGKLFEMFLVVVIGVSLVPVINTIVTDANISGSTGTILSLVPMIFVIIIVYGMSKGII